MAGKTFIPWIGWTRLVAMFMVCLCHACDPLSAFGAPEEKGWIALVGSFLRPCVPLFVMLTGALLLPSKDDFGTLFRKRILRVVWPFLLWTALYSALPWALHTCGVTPEHIQRVFFPFATPLHVDAASIPRTFVLSLLQFNQYAVQLWYIYVLIGLYLFLPILSAWLREATPKAKVTFLGLWGATLLLWWWPLLLHALLRTSWGAALLSDYTLRFLGDSTWSLAQLTSFEATPLLGVCDWNAFGGLYLFSGFVGYLVLGHVLRELTLSLKRTLAIALPLIVIGYAIIYTGTQWLWHAPNVTSKGLEYFWWYNSLPVALMATGLFLLLKQVTWAPPPVARLLEHFGKCGFGIFCAHYVAVTGFYYLLPATLPVPLLLLFSALLGLAATWLLLALLHACKLGRWVG